MKLRIIVLLTIACTLCSLPVAAQQGTWSMGFNLISVSSSAETEPGQTTDAALTIGNGYALGIEGTFLMTKTLAVEMSMSTGERDLSAVGGPLDGMGAGSFWVLPVTVTAKWMIPLYGKFSPYVGVGATYLFSHGYEIADELSALDLDDIEINGRVGFALQAGVDYDVNDRWYCTLDLKYLDLNGDLDLRLSDGSLFQRLALEGNLFQIEAGFGFRF